MCCTFGATHDLRCTESVPFATGLLTTPPPSGGVKKAAARSIGNLECSGCLQVVDAPRDGQAASPSQYASGGGIWNPRQARSMLSS
jgi:hypothetical protein